MSSVFDPKHAMTVWDSEVDGLRAAPAVTATPRSPGKENSPEKAAPAAAATVAGCRIQTLHYLHGQVVRATGRQAPRTRAACDHHR